MSCYLLGAVVVTARLWAHPSGLMPAGNWEDIDFFTWFVHYAAAAVAHGHLPALVTTTLNAPAGVNLMWNTPFLLPGMLLTPVTLLAGPQTSLTVALTAGFAGSAASMFALLRECGASRSAAGLGGAVYGFSPALLEAGLGHYNFQFAVLPPLMIGALLRIVTGRGHPVRNGAWLGLLTAAQPFTGSELLADTVTSGDRPLTREAVGRIGSTLWPDAPDAVQPQREMQRAQTHDPGQAGEIPGQSSGDSSAAPA
jgi:hypothetical protein